MNRSVDRTNVLPVIVSKAKQSSRALRGTHRFHSASMRKPRMRRGVSVCAVDIRHDLLRETRFQLDPKPLGRLFDGLGQ